MVVDDSAMIRLQVRRALAAAGFTVIEACDGVEALGKLADASPALMICDVNMPRMSGIELLESIQGAAAKFPVVMLTTEGQPDLIQRAQSLGAKGWIIKPFKPDLLVMVAKKLAVAA